jgi:hypothetical protein
MVPSSPGFHFSRADASSAAGCVVTYVVRVRETVGSSSFVDMPAVQVAMGSFLAAGAAVASKTESVLCPVPNGAVVLRVWARDGAGNSPSEPVESSAWIRDTLPPVTVATLADPSSFVWLPAQSLSVTNSSEVALSLSSGPEHPSRFSVVVSRANTQTNQVYNFNLTGGQVVVASPWDGAQAFTVVRHGSVLSCGGFASLRGFFHCSMMCCAGWVVLWAGVCCCCCVRTCAVVVTFARPRRTKRAMPATRWS